MPRPTGTCIQVVDADGKTLNTDGPAGPAHHPGSPVRRPASQGRAPNIYFSTTVGGLDVREVVAALPPGFTYRSDDGVPVGLLAGGGALQITTPLTGVNQELRHLALALWLIVLGRCGHRRPARAWRWDAPCCGRSTA